MTSASRCTAIGQLLEQERSLVGQLASALHSEHQAITARDAELLEQLVQSKQQLLIGLGLTHKRRIELLHEAGLSHDKAGFASMLTLCSTAGHDYRGVWQELQDALHACQHQNEINGKLVESGQRITHNTLAILLGGQGEGSELYTQQGKSVTSPLGSRTVAKA